MSDNVCKFCGATQQGEDTLGYQCASWRYRGSDVWVQSSRCQKYGEMITDDQISEAVATLVAVARRFLPESWSIHLQCYRGGEVFAGLCQFDEQCQERVVSLHESYQDAIDTVMRANSPENPEGSP